MAIALPEILPAMPFLHIQKAVRTPVPNYLVQAVVEGADVFWTESGHLAHAVNVYGSEGEVAGVLLFAPAISVERMREKLIP